MTSRQSVFSVKYELRLAKQFITQRNTRQGNQVAASSGWKQSSFAVRMKKPEKKKKADSHIAVYTPRQQLSADEPCLVEVGFPRNWTGEKIR
jgi:hypothetical protein